MNGSPADTYVSSVALRAAFDTAWEARKQALDVDLGTARRTIESDAGPLPADYVGASPEGEEAED